MKLATKITLPFLALFTFLLVALGVVLAHQILTEVERRVENEHRFVLEVATFPGFVFNADTLRQIRDRAAHSSGETVSGARGEFAVLQNMQAPVTTFESEPGGRILAELQAAERASKFPEADESIRRTTLTLDQHSWLVLYTSRGRTPAGRRTYLLYPYEEIRRAQNSALMRIVGLGALGLGLAAGLGSVIARWISAPMRSLAAAATKVRTSGLQPPEKTEGLDIASTDEIGDLARAFQAMLESLRASQAELLRTERLAAAGRLATSVAHEIRNPLTSMRMTLQMMQQKAADADPSTQQAYVILLGEVDRLTLAVDDLMTVARPKPAQRVPTDLNQVVENTLKFMERQLSHAHIAAKMELDAALPKQLPLDPNKLRQVLVNLILNALDAMVRDGIVTVRTRWEDESKTALLEIADTGPGIPESVRERVFDLFVSTKAGGGGLGLAIAKQIAEEHGGTIQYETSSKGTTFTLRLQT